LRRGLIGSNHKSPRRRPCRGLSGGSGSRIIKPCGYVRSVIDGADMHGRCQRTHRCRIYQQCDRGLDRNFTTLGGKSFHSIEERINGSKFRIDEAGRPAGARTGMADVDRSFCCDRYHQRGDAPASPPLIVRAARCLQKKARVRTRKCRFLAAPDRAAPQACRVGWGWIFGNSVVWMGSTPGAGCFVRVDARPEISVQSVDGAP
jgi:hypothetical protein